MLPQPFLRALCAGAVLFCGLAACAPPTPEAKPRPPAPTLAPTLPPTPEPILTPGAVNTVLLELDAGVDALFTHIPAEDWSAATADVERMTAAWYAHGVEVALAGASQATLNALDSALAGVADRTAAQDAVGALQAANLASASVADLYDLYLPPPTGDLRRLAMLERQLWLEAQSGEAAVIQGDFAQLQAVWERTAPQIRAQGGEAFAGEFEASLGAQAGFIQANDWPGLRAEATRAMQLVGLLR